MTQQPDRSVFEQLIARLRHAQIDWDAENIADALWLARYVEGQSDRADRSTQAAATPKIRTETVTGEAAPPLPPPELGLYAQGQSAQSPNQPNQSNPAAPGLPFKTPTAPALRQTLAIGRSLRPLRRRVDSYRRRVLDEEATAEQTAEQQFCMTVVQPEPENWLEVALVMEYTPSSFIWQDTLQSFKQLLEHQGAFRSVNVWHLKVVQDTASQTAKEQTKAANGTANAVQLFTHLPGSRPQKPRSLKELIDPAGRRLILVLSDCVSAAWQQGVIQEACLELWAQRGQIAIMQFLPGRLWGRTALRSGVAVKLSSLTPGAANRELLLHEVPVWSDSQTDRGLKLPIVTLEPGSLGLWAKMVAGFGEQRVAGVWFDEGWKDWVQAEATPAGDWTAEQLVDRFNTTASLLARKLAILMAIVPVQLPIIYLIQATMLRESTPLHLAEVFMSGLIRQEAGAAAAEQATEPAYEFVAGVRERLLDLADPGEAEQLLDRVSQYVGQKIGRSLYSFTALLRLEQELQGTDVADLLKFATVTKQAVKRLGGAYAELVRAMEAQTQTPQTPQTPQTIQFQPLQILEFTWVKLTNGELTLEKAIEIANTALQQGLERSLKDLEEAILRGFYHGLTYQQISEQLGYSEKYLRQDIGNLFWQDLTYVIEERVSKINFLGPLQRWYQRQQPLDATNPQPALTAGWAASSSLGVGDESQEGTPSLELSLEELIEIANAALQRGLERSLQDLEEAILRGSYHGLTYPQIAEQLGYNEKYLEQDIGNLLWQDLTSVVGERVSKNNFRGPLQRWHQRQQSLDATNPQQALPNPSFPATFIQKRIPGTAKYYSEPLGDTTLEMVLIPGGSFLMGSPEDEPERRESEGPQHEVTVPSFFMGRYPVTQAQWRWVAGLPPIFVTGSTFGSQELDPDPSDFKGDNRPVENISWHEAVQFCARLSAHTGRPYRLPSEAEWEYACRAGTTTPFHFGEMITTDLANYDGNYTYNDGPKGEYRRETTPVDQFGIANAFGLCEMHGNVWEWCADHWHGSYEGAPIDGSTWVDQDAGEDNSYVLRGGSWYYVPRNCRSAARNPYYAGARAYNFGFRVVCSAPGLFPSP